MSETKRDTNIRVSLQTYSLVRTRGLLETFHQRRLSLDDAIEIASRFTYAFGEFLLGQVKDDNLTLVTNVDETLRFYGPNMSSKIPTKVHEQLMRVTDELGKRPRGKGKK